MQVSWSYWVQAEEIPAEMGEVCAEGAQKDGWKGSGESQCSRRTLYVLIT